MTGDRKSSSEYDGDMNAAKAAGIDAFALNIGTDDFTDEQLGYAYESASKNGMSVFISFDFNWWTIGQASDVGAKISKYAGQDAQLKVDGKVFVSSFAGDGLDLGKVQSAAGISLFWAPNFKPGGIGNADALLSWMAWPSDGKNKAPSGGNNVTVAQSDTSYTQALGGKPYVAREYRPGLPQHSNNTDIFSAVSAWFSTHYGLEVSYSKNWVFPSDLLWYERWNEILILSPQYIEILTWNDYGESHYLGPLSSPHTDDGNSKWTNDMPHDGWLTMAMPYIAAFKAGSKSISAPSEDQLVYWYRPATKTATCDNTDTCMKPWPSPSPNPNYFTGPPDGHETVEDSVFVVALLKSAGTVTITSGSNQAKQYSAQAGPNAFSVPLGAGKQSFALTRGGSTVLSGDSLKEVSDQCVCGIYNYNAYVGTLPAGKPDALQGNGLKNFMTGLAASCAPTPSLGTASAGAGAANNTGVGPSATSSNTAAASASSPPQTTSTPSSPPPSSSSSSAPVVQQQQQSSSTTPQSVASITTPPNTASSTAAAAGTGCVMTTLSQFGPANCLPKGCSWQGPAGSDPPSPCDTS